MCLSLSSRMGGGRGEENGRRVGEVSSVYDGVWEERRRREGTRRHAKKWSFGVLVMGFSS